MRAESPKSRPYALRCIASIVVLGLWAAASLHAAEPVQRIPVAVVTDLSLADLERLTHRGAVGLLVPDAGPRTSAVRARAALERGAVRNSLLGDSPPGPALIRVYAASGVPASPVIVLALPRGGEQPNDRRYAIAVLADGYRGVLTSDSTRIPGLVSIADVAPTALGAEDALSSAADDDPVATLRNLDERIESNRDAKPVVLLLSLALVVAAAVFRRAAVLPAFAAVLLANLALGIFGTTSVWIAAIAVALAVAAAAAFGRTGALAQGLLLAGVLGGYLVAMAADERWVALSPLGPTQNARFYGLSNLLATLLLVPALAGAVLLGRTLGMWAFAAVAALALITVGGSSFGADGGGAVVLLAAFLVLAVLKHGFSRRIALGGAAVTAVLAIALALGGSSHVTEALADGPVGLAEDLARRVELSFLRATSSVGVALLVFGGIGIFVLLARWERRPLLVALLVALGVSLVVNDSPNDVVLAGLACYVVLSTAPALARRATGRARPAPRVPRARTARAGSP
jgi:hypothetical protein